MPKAAARKAELALSERSEPKGFSTSRIARVAGNPALEMTNY